VRRITALAVTVAALAAAPAAQAQVFQAVDGTPADNFNNRWSPQELTIRPGQTVTWSFTGTTGIHNVASTSANWDFDNGTPKSGSPPASHPFPAPGVYTFVCEAHADPVTGTGMAGRVIVTDANGNPPPPPPPPPLSEQPFPNDAGAPTGLEIADALPPRLTHVVTRSRGHIAVVRFRIDEPAVVALRVKQARLTVKRRRAMLLKGRRTLTVRGLAAGRYRLDIIAHDLAGNRSRAKHSRVTVRG
jgi:plastocyanin